MNSFDVVIDRRNTDSYKWDNNKELFGKEDILPMWVADMDFKCPDALLEAFAKRLEHGILGYTSRNEKYFEAIMSWMKRRYSWEVDREWITYCPPGVLPAICLLINQLTEPGDKIIMQLPNYDSLMDAVKDNDRILVENPLIYQDGKYYFDFEDMIKKIDSRTKMLLLCSPNNPTGMVWKHEDLMMLGEICVKNNIIVISDEVHCDFIFKGNVHTPFSSLSPEIAQNSITCFSPNKTFNVAGVLTSTIIIPNEKIRNRYLAALKTFQMRLDNIFGRIAVEVLYSNISCEQWLDELLLYLEESFDYAVEEINRIKGLKAFKPEGTYLLLIDFSGLNMTDADLRSFLVNNAKLGLCDGYEFGPNMGQKMRMNLACPRKIIEEAIKRLKNSVESLDLNNI